MFRPLTFVLAIGTILMSTISTPNQAAENYALYSQIMNELPEESIKTIGNPDTFDIGVNENGHKFYRYEWSDVTVTINLMPDAEIQNHLNGFVGYVQHLSNQKGISLDHDLSDRILKTRMVLGFIIEPGHDKQGKTEELLGAITYNTKSLMFYSDAIYDENAKLVIGP